MNKTAKILTIHEELINSFLPVFTVKLLHESLFQALTGDVEVCPVQVLNLHSLPESQSGCNFFNWHDIERKMHLYPQLSFSKIYRVMSSLHKGSKIKLHDHQVSEC